LQAALHRGSDSALHLRGAHCLAEQIGIAAEVLRRCERDRIDALLDRDVAGGRESRDAVDAYPGAAITGVVTDIQAGAAGQFSLFPQSNSTGNFQKVTQVVGVRIAFTNTAGQYLVPGMNVTVHIHKQTQP
jgi:hypothetical protein